MASIVALLLLGLLKSTQVTAQIDPAFAASHSCDVTCQANVNEIVQYERNGFAYPDDPFYKVSPNFTPRSKPGSVLSVEAHTNLTNYTVPSGLTMSRFQYTTTNLNGTAIPTSAYILWPFQAYVPKKSKQNSGIPVVAWAHGTSGTTATCAPSNFQSLQYHFIVPYPLVMAGYAVVAPDYAGLGVSHFANGTRIPHAWLSAPAQANDLANAVIAARSAFPELSENFVAMGHSHGGATAYAFAERQAKTPVKGYLGTIAIAPPTTSLEHVAGAFTGNVALQAGFGYQPRLIAAVTADYPAYNFSGFSEVGLQRWQLVTEVDACLAAENTAYSQNTSFYEAGKPKWWEDKTVQTWYNRVSMGGRPIAGPVLVVAGEQDAAVPLQFVQKSFKATCELKGNTKQGLELAVYQGLNHFPVILASQTKRLAWIKDRFDGDSSKSKCSSSYIELPRSAGYTSIFPNWLVSRPSSPADLRPQF